MSVEDPKTVDFVSLGTGSNIALLVVSDHLEWDDSFEHELALQEKLNSYLRFIESGELYTRFPKATERRVEIRVVLRHAPNAGGIKVLEKIQGAIEKAGFHFSYQVGIALPNEFN